MSGLKTVYYKCIWQGSDDDMADLIDFSQRKNKSKGVTGNLFFHKETREVTQVIEGEDKVINKLYRKIMRDKRCKDHQLMSAFRAKGRMYKTWMNFDNTNNFNPDILFPSKSG